MLIARGPRCPVTPFGVIMYQRLIRKITLTNAHRTTGQRAVCRITPRHESLRPWGWNHFRLAIHIKLEAKMIGRKYRKNEPSFMLTIGACMSSATVGSAQSSANDSDHSVYQLCANRNWRAWPGE